MLRLIGSRIGVALGVLVFANTLLAADDVPAERIVSEYTAMAGSKENAHSVVEGLRTSRVVTLASELETVTFTPPTKRMGNANVDLALAMARASLAQVGIDNPTPSQLQAALMGGSVTTVSGTHTFEGILALRAEGKGWGAIGDALGLKVGALKRSDPSGPSSSSARARGLKRLRRRSRRKDPCKPSAPSAWNALNQSGLSGLSAETNTTTPL
jgi:hypothetical protein